MKVSIDWLKELVDLKISVKELAELLPLRTIATKEVTDEFIELDMKGYNRADLLSLRGVALEVAAITDSKLKLEEESEQELHKNMRSHEIVSLDVKVENPFLCPIYCLVKIEGLKVEKSLPEVIKKLNSSGIRSVNNIADITNLVMLEYGQPLHAFDARAVKNEKILVRTAKKGERITTLDGKTRDLEEYDLLIADPQNNLGIAGVMGGMDSEITDSTTTILLEAAIFDPVSVRKTSRRLGLHSEASKRFIHGLTKQRLFQALSGAIKDYEKLGGKITAISMVGNYEREAKKITLRKEKVNSLIGVSTLSEEIEEYLKKLYFDVSAIDNKKWEVTPPFFRLDVEIEEDVIEEVARMYGYEKIPPKALEGELPKKIDQKLFNLIHNLKLELVKLGLTEVQTYSFFSTAVLENLEIDRNKLVKIANPISSETEYLRDIIWPNLIEVISRNIKQGFDDIAIFEIGKVYSHKEDGAPEEKYSLTFALMNGSDNPIQELYRLYQKLKNSLGVKLVHPPGEILRAELFHPTRFINNMGEVHPRVVNKFRIDSRIAVLEITL